METLQNSLKLGKKKGQTFFADDVSSLAASPPKRRGPVLVTDLDAVLRASASAPRRPPTPPTPPPPPPLVNRHFQWMLGESSILQRSDTTS